MARDFILLVLVCMGCTQPLQNYKTPPKKTASMEPETAQDGAARKAKDGGESAMGEPATAEPQDAMAKGAAGGGGTDDDDDSPDAGSDHADDDRHRDAGVMRDASADAPADASSAPQDDRTIVGSWEGDLEDSLNRSIHGCVTVTQVGTPGPAGQSFYTGAFNCDARLTYLETVGDVHSFDEVISRGTGCPRGILSLRLTSDDTLRYDWYLNAGEIPEGVGMMNRVDTCP